MKKILAPLTHSKRQFTFLLLILIVLCFLYIDRYTTPLADGLWEVIDPIAGILAFFITLTILYNQAKAKWENSLEKRLTIEYWAPGKDKEVGILVAEVQNAYLAGESDIRAWVQQLGSQISGGNLEFDMNWDDPPPVIKPHDHTFYKHYMVKIYLTTNPFLFSDDDRRKNKIEVFLQKNFKHSFVKGSLDDLPIRWIRR